MQLKEILKDRQKGAGELLRQVVAWFLRHPDALSEAELDPVLRILRRTRPSMVCFTVLADRIETGIEAHPDWDDVRILETIQKEVHSAEDKMIARFGEMLKERGPSRIVTLSYSSSVLKSLTASADLVESLHILESKPGGEGRKTLSAASESIGEAILYFDDDIQKAVDAADFGVIGADTVFADGTVLNKVLSMELGELLKKQDKPLYVLATSWKRSKEQGTMTHVQGEDRELFELVPAELVTDVVSDP